MRVHGVDGLRVVDASAMPYVTNGNIYAPVMMLAEKAADLILGNTPLAARAGRLLPARAGRAAVPATSSVGAFLDALGRRTPAPASGAAAAITGALGAALAELAARLAKDEPAVERAQERCEAGWSSWPTRTARPTPRSCTSDRRRRAPARSRCRSRSPRVASEVAELADGLAARLRFPMVGDAEASAELARAAAHVCRRLAA